MQHSINFWARLSLVRTVWYRFDCTGYCLSSRFHLSRTIIALQVFSFPNVSLAMSSRKWMFHRESSAGSFASLRSNLLSQLTMPRSPLFLRHVFVLFIKCIVLRCRFPFSIPEKSHSSKHALVACFHLSYFCNSLVGILLCKEKRNCSSHKFS